MTARFSEAEKRRNFSRSYKGTRPKRNARAKEVAGPYRSQSSVPSVRKKATKREHRTVETRSAPERRAAAARAALTKPPFEPKTRVEKRKSARERSAIRAAFPKPKPRKAPQVPTLSAKSPGNRPGYEPDPIATAVERDVIKPSQEAGALPKHKTVGQEIYQKIAEYGPTVLTLGPEVKAGAAGLKAVLAGAESGGVKVGGSKILSRVLKPAAVSSADDAEAIAQRAAQRAAAKQASGVKAAAKRGAGRITRREGRADAAVVRKVTGTQTRRQAASAQGAPLALTKGAVAQTLPVVRGHEQALTENFGKTIKTTARAVPGLVTAPVGQAAGLATTGGRAVSEGLHAAGVPGFRGYSGKQILAPTVEIGKEQFAFAKQVAKTVTASDSAEVQKAVEDELGLMLPIMLGLGTKAAAGKITKGRVTEAVRRIAEDVRQGAGRGRGAHNGKAPRVFEKSGQRKAEARRTARHRTRSERERRDRTEPILREAKKAEGSEVIRRGVGPRRGLRGRPSDLEVRTRDLLGFAVRHGLPLDKPAAALAEVKRIRSTLKPLPEGVDLPKDKLHTRDVIDYIEANPRVLTDSHLRRSVDAYRRQARHAREHPELSPEHSEPGRFTSAAVTRGVPLAGERFPQSIRGETRAEPTRGRDAKDVLRREAKSDRQRAKRLGRKAATREARARAITRELAIRERSEPTRAKTNVGVAAKAQRMGSQAETYRRGQKQAAELAKRKRRAAYEVDPAVAEEFTGEMRGRLQREGLPEPEYVSTSRARDTPTYGATGAKLTNFPGRSKRKRGTAEEYGMIQEDLPHTLRESIARPISRRESYAAMRSFLRDNEYREQDPAGRISDEFTSDQARKMFENGTIDRSNYVLVPRQLYARAEGKFNPEQAAAGLRAVLDGDQLPGRKFKIVRRPAAEEFFNQLTGAFSPKLAKINQITSTLILKTSPAWAAMQVVAEYAQGAVAQPKILNPRFVRRALREYKAMAPHERQHFDSWVGVTTRSLESPDDMRLELGTGDMAAASDAIKAMDRTPLGKLITAIPKTIGKIDEVKGGRIRTLVVAAKLDRDLNGRFLEFLDGIRGLHGEIAKASEEMKGQPLSKQLAYVAERPELAHRYVDYLDNVMGNWSALTKNERAAAGVVIFYPFIRMATRWTFYAFPKEHPIKAALLYYLGQQNATELKKLLGQDPSFFTGWATVPLHLGDGETKLIPLSRIAPGAGPAADVLEGAVGSGDLGVISTQALRALQPGLAAAVTAATGVSPFTGEQEANRGAAALAQLLTLPAPVRVADELLTPSGRKETDAALPVVGAFLSTERQKALDKLFDKLSEAGTVTKTARSLIAPAVPRRVDYERDLTKLRSVLEALEANSSSRRRELGQHEEERAAGQPEAERRRIAQHTAKEATAMTRRYEGAQTSLDKMLTKYGIKADEWTGDIYGIGAYGAEPSNAPPAGTLGGVRVRGAASTSTRTPPAGTLGGKPARGVLKAGEVGGGGSVPPAGTLGGVKVR